SILVLLPLLALATSSMLSDLSKELVDEGLLTLDEDAVPTTTCMITLRNGSSISKTCYMTEGFGPRSAGCYAVWAGTSLIAQGCYSNQEISLRDQCRKDECKSDGKSPVVSFCCCFGHLCNA
ncbi:hypothetical protein PMAYCL1PPCAC_16380, partial [Pristionchus mayeri]